MPPLPCGRGLGRGVICTDGRSYAAFPHPALRATFSRRGRRSGCSHFQGLSQCHSDQCRFSCESILLFNPCLPGRECCESNQLASSLIALFVSLPLLAADGDATWPRSPSNFPAPPPRSRACARHRRSMPRSIRAAPCCRCIQRQRFRSTQLARQLAGRERQTAFRRLRTGRQHWGGSGQRIRARSLGCIPGQSCHRYRFGIEQARIPAMRLRLRNLKGDNGLEVARTRRCEGRLRPLEGDAATEIASWQTHTRHWSANAWASPPC